MTLASYNLLFDLNSFTMDELLNNSRVSNMIMFDYLLIINVHIIEVENVRR